MLRGEGRIGIGSRKAFMPQMKNYFTGLTNRQWTIAKAFHCSAVST